MLPTLTIALRQSTEAGSNMDGYDGNWVIDLHDSRFEIRPHPTSDDLTRIYDFVKEIGYEMPYSDKEYSLKDVQEELRHVGQAAFLGKSELRHDISAKTAPEEAEALVAHRLAELAPADHLVITDPYLFPSNPKEGENEYAERLVRLITPILKPGSRLTCLVNDRSNRNLEDSVKSVLGAKTPGYDLKIHHCDDFHDRFWIADSSRGVVVGASLNGLGRRIFFIDQLSEDDVLAVVAEIRHLGLDI